MARNTGSEARYRLVALNASPNVRDAIAYREGRDPTVKVAVLSTEPDGVADAELVQIVADALAQPQNRMVNGQVAVRSAVTAVVNITAALTILPATPRTTILPAAEQALRAAWATEGGLGRDITRDWVKARLLVPGVYAVNLSAPANDTTLPPYEAASIGTVTLTVAGENV
jgi:phage-related baseplate assembly protein